MVVPVAVLAHAAVPLLISGFSSGFFQFRLGFPLTIAYYFFKVDYYIHLDPDLHLTFTLNFALYGPIS